MDQGKEIIDLGHYEERREKEGPSPYYEMERKEIDERKYPTTKLY